MSIVPFRSNGDTQSWPEGFEVPEEEGVEQAEVIHQWIAQVTGFSSQFGDDEGWSAAQVVGPPRVESYGDDGLAWAPLSAGTSHEWLELRIERPCQVQRLRIRENSCGGAFCRLQLFDPNLRQFVTALEREARCGQHARAIRVEDISVPEGHQVVTDRLRLEFNQEGGYTWYEVDAVQVTGMVGSLAHDVVTRLANQQAARISKQISSLMNDPDTADCTLVVSASNEEAVNRFSVHRGVLAARCALFRAMLNNKELPLGGEKVLRGIDPTLVKMILEWIYTGTVSDLDRRDIVALTTASDYFQIDDLTEYCVAVFTCLLTVPNAVLLYAHFDKLCSEPLKKAALSYCGKFFLAISRTPAFQELTQPQLLAVIESYKTHLNRGSETSASSYGGGRERRQRKEEQQEQNTSWPVFHRFSWHVWLLVAVQAAGVMLVVAVCKYAPQETIKQEFSRND